MHFFKNVFRLKHTKNTVIFILSKKHFVQNVVLCFSNIFTNFHEGRIILVLSIFKTPFQVLQDFCFSIHYVNKLHAKTVIDRANFFSKFCEGGIPLYCATISLRYLYIYFVKMVRDLGRNKSEVF